MILNHQRRVRVSISGLEKFLAAAAQTLASSAPFAHRRLVTDAQIARWNRAYRGKNRPTDVLSFPADGPAPQPPFQAAASTVRGSSPVVRATVKFAARAMVDLLYVLNLLEPYLGDIAIAPAVARRNARRFGRAFDHEMRILILHGILHLMGYDHETDSGQMDRRENRLRRELGLL